MFVLVPDGWLGEKARKGRKEREQEGGVPYIYQQQKGHTNTNCCIFKSVKYLKCVCSRNRTVVCQCHPTPRHQHLMEQLNITTFVVIYLLLPKNVCVLHFLALKGKGGELNLVWGSILRETLLEHLPARTGSRQNDSPRHPWASLGHTTAPICFWWLDWFNTQTESDTVVNTDLKTELTAVKFTKISGEEVRQGITRLVSCL